ncbi:YraN family protein [Planctomycetota bacterium]|nr:YraN family protein [Planctomycetota bacterium]
MACRALRDLGWQIRARNLRAPEAELDLVGMDGAVTVVVEVKTGRQPAGGWAPQHLPRHRFRSDAVERRQRAARRLAGARGGAWGREVQRPQDLAGDRGLAASLGRVDLIEVLVDPNQRRSRLHHFRDVAARVPSRCGPSPSAHRAQ